MRGFTAQVKIRHAIGKVERFGSVDRVLGWVLAVEEGLVTTVSNFTIARQFNTEEEAEAYLHSNGLYSGYKVFKIPILTSGTYGFLRGELFK